MKTATATGTGQSLRDLVGYILEKHHSYMRSELPFLEERIAKMCANHGDVRPELFSIQQYLQDLRDDIGAHLEKEEQILFPYIAGLEDAVAIGAPAPHACFPSIQFPIRVMLHEHDAAESLLSNLREVTANYSTPPGFCENGAEFYRRLAALESDLKEHIRLENEDLFPRAVRLEESMSE